MSVEYWSDRELREFVVSATNSYSFSFDEEWEQQRARFREQATRIVPAIQARVLAEVGATTSPEGVAMFAAEVVEHFDGPRAWLVLSSTPWDYLERWVGDEVIAAYRRATGDEGDDEKLAGITATSTRPAITDGETD
jgi:hypothetical protein